MEEEAGTWVWTKHTGLFPGTTQVPPPTLKQDPTYESCLKTHREFCLCLSLFGLP